MIIAGVDEVGRGPLAGPVVAAAVIFPVGLVIDGVKDSKAISEKKRDIIAKRIKQEALAWAIGRAEVAEIDRINIFQASLLAMQRAVEQLSVKPCLAQVDGKHCPSLACETQAIIKGDATVPVISAASILAKVERDQELIALHEHFPEYGFAQHKGYGTKQHLAALTKFGPTCHHRQSFAPIKALLDVTA